MLVNRVLVSFLHDLALKAVRNSRDLVVNFLLKDIYLFYKRLDLSAEFEFLDCVSQFAVYLSNFATLFNFCGNVEAHLLKLVVHSCNQVFLDGLFLGLESVIGNQFVLDG